MTFTIDQVGAHNLRTDVYIWKELTGWCLQLIDKWVLYVHKCLIKSEGNRFLLTEKKEKIHINR